MFNTKHRRKHHVSGGSDFPVTGLVGFWKLDESSGNAEDAHTTEEDLTDNNTVGASSGQTIGSLTTTVRTFVRVNSEHFTASSTSVLDVGIDDFSICGWLRINSGSLGNVAEPVLCKRLNGNPSNAGWCVNFIKKPVDNSIRTNTTHFGFSDGTNEVNFLQVLTGFDHDQWFHFILTVDRTANEAKLYINNSLISTLDISAVTGSMGNSETAVMGKWISEYAYCDMSHIGMWIAHVLTSDERTYLYNSGTPIAP